MRQMPVTPPAPTTPPLPPLATPTPTPTSGGSDTYFFHQSDHTNPWRSWAQLQECQKDPVSMPADKGASTAVPQTRKRPASQAYTEALGDQERVGRWAGSKEGGEIMEEGEDQGGKGRVGQDAGNWSSKQAGRTTMAWAFGMSSDSIPSVVKITCMKRWIRIISQYCKPDNYKDLNK
jgi:hypothetical protein